MWVSKRFRSTDLHAANFLAAIARRGYEGALARVATVTNAHDHGVGALANGLENTLGLLLLRFVLKVTELIRNVAVESGTRRAK